MPGIEQRPGSADVIGDRDLVVLIVINTLGAGGAERSLAELLPRYVSSGIRPTVVCLGMEREEMARDVGASGVEILTLASGSPLAQVRALRRLIRQRHPDLIHTTLFESDIVGRLAAVRTDVPVLTSVVNTTYDPIRLQDPDVGRFGLAAVRALDGWTARHLTTHFHAITEAVKASTVRSLRVPPDRITVIERGRDAGRLGMPSEDRKESARGRLGIRHDDIVLVNVGRQEFQKGQTILLKALELLADDRVRLIIVGRTGAATGEIQRWAGRPTLRGRVDLLGHRDDVPEILAAADVFVFPSLYEGLGGALIEAMALGLPVVASRIPAIQEVMGGSSSAVLVTPGSPAELAAAISTVIADPPYARRLGARGRELFVERFSLDRSARRMVQLYRDVASSGRHPPLRSTRGASRVPG